MTHPIACGSRKDRDPGNQVADRFRYIIKAAGKAYEICCRIRPVPINALNAEEEPR